MSIKLTNLNKVNDIGANCCLLEAGPFNIIIDAGINPKEKGYNSLPKISYLKKYCIDYIIITHAHLDHIGALPILVTSHNKAIVLISKETMSIAKEILVNSYSIMLSQKKKYNIKEYPLYRKKDVFNIDKRCLIVSLNKKYIFKKMGKILEITFYQAGHTLGANGILLSYDKKNIFFSGDVLFENQLTIKGANFPKNKLDILVLETTRGEVDSKNFNRKKEFDRLLSIINNSISKTGSCLIPVFALGRMQELLTFLYKSKMSNKLIESPIFSSGLGISLTKIFDNYTQNNISFKNTIIPFLKLKKFKYKNDVNKGLYKKGIYLVSSGMLIENTPSYLLASLMLGNNKNSIVFVGYCDPTTPGGKLQSTPYGENFFFKDLNIKIPVLANIFKVDLSSHSNKEELINFACKINPKVILLTHGSCISKKIFKNNLEKKLPESDIYDLLPFKKYNF